MSKTALCYTASEWMVPEAGEVNIDLEFLREDLNTMSRRLDELEKTVRKVDVEQIVREHIQVAIDELTKDVSADAERPGRLWIMGFNGDFEKMISIKDALWIYLDQLAPGNLPVGDEALATLSGGAFRWARWMDAMAKRLRRVAQDALARESPPPQTGGEHEK